MTNTLSPGDKVLIARYGMFSHRWIELCKRHRFDVEGPRVRMGARVRRPSGFAERLAADGEHEIKAVLVTHNETATGVVSDIGAVREAMDGADHPALLMADCVSSLASMDFRMDEWGVDVAVAGSRKVSCCTPVLPSSASARRPWRRWRARPARASFSTCAPCMTPTSRVVTRTQPAVQLLKGLRMSVDLLLEEGLEAVFARHHRLAEGVRQAVAAWGLSLCARSPELCSNSVSAIYVPEGFDSNALANHAYEAHGVSFGIGLGEMAGKAFRIGHLGSLTPAARAGGSRDHRDGDEGSRLPDHARRRCHGGSGVLPHAPVAAPFPPRSNETYHG